MEKESSLYNAIIKHSMRRAQKATEQHHTHARISEKIVAALTSIKLIYIVQGRCFNMSMRCDFLASYSCSIFIPSSPCVCYGDASSVFGRIFSSEDFCCCCPVWDACYRTKEPNIPENTRIPCRYSADVWLARLTDACNICVLQPQNWTNLRVNTNAEHAFARFSSLSSSYCVYVFFVFLMRCCRCSACCSF